MARERTRVVSFGDRKILAIKLVRELGGFGLREAKDLVESASEFEFDFGPRTQALLREAAQQGIRFQHEHLSGNGEATGAHQLPGGSLAVRFVACPHMINAIKLVRELTHLGLAESKGIVERRDVIARDLDQAAAEAMVARFAQIGAEIEIVGGPSTTPKPRAVVDDVWGAFSEEDDDF